MVKRKLTEEEKSAKEIEELKQALEVEKTSTEVFIDQIRISRRRMTAIKKQLEERESGQSGKN